MKLIKRLINNFITWIKSLFITKKQRQFAKEALDARTIHKHNQKVQRSYFRKLPRRTGFKKAPPVSTQLKRQAEIQAIKDAVLQAETNKKLGIKTEKPKKKQISQKLRDERELGQAKRSFFIELITARGKEIQEPFIKECKAKKAARKSTNKTLQIA